uniref:TIL domain containing protein n=1 Tax=Rhipicephalus appendiculatus TaxID=34631 RepID=A0A131YQS8_RHIAP
MEQNSQIFLSLRFAAIVLVLGVWMCEGLFDREELKKSCKPWELFGCTMKGPGCGEKKCDVEKTLGFCMPVCKYGCWCRGNLYRRKRDNKCVPKHECLL